VALEKQITCFDWHNCSSQYLDGDLEEPLRTDAEKHLETCPACMNHYKHYGLILSALADQPRSQLPPHIKSAPLAAVMPRLETARISLSQWERIPWYLRVTLEAAGIVAFVLICISSSPKIRSLYEKNVEKNLSDFKEGLNTGETLALNDGFDKALTKVESIAPGTPASVATEGDEVAGEDDLPKNSVHAGQSQLWRFTLKTVSPDELRPKVIQALQELNIPAKTPGLAGSQVPGGIEFDLILPLEIVPNIKHALEKVIPGAVGGKEFPVGSEIFSWYKVKSRKKIPEGMSKVVIWLSQPN
jgi:hypothetical protein